MNSRDQNEDIQRSQESDIRKDNFQEKENTSQNLQNQDAAEISMGLAGEKIAFVKETVVETVHQIKDYAAGSLSSAKDTVVHVGEKAAEKIVFAKDTVVETVIHAKDVASEKIGSFTGAIKDTASATAGYISHKASDVKEGIVETKDIVFHRVEDAINYIIENAVHITNDLRMKLAQIIAVKPEHTEQVTNEAIST